jgi:hypothetical protein
MIAGIISWIIFSILIGIIGSNRKIGFGGAFFLSLLLSPLIGLIFTLVSKSLAAEKFEQELLQTQKMQQKTMEKITNQNLNTITEDLRKIKDLLDNGILNSEEYEKMKKTIINKYELSITEESIEETQNVKFEIDNNNLTEIEKDRVRNMANNLKNGEIITKHMKNNKIEIMSIKNYDAWRKLYGEDMLKILVKKE